MSEATDNATLYLKCPHCNKYSRWITLEEGTSTHRFRCPNCYKTFSAKTTLNVEYSKKYNFKSRPNKISKEIIK